MKSTVILIILLSCISLSAQAGRTINSVLLNGATTATVSAGETVTVTIEVTTTGRNWENKWKSTSYTLNGRTICENTSNSNGRGTYTKSFGITAPSTNDNYSLNFYAYHSENCWSGYSNRFSLVDGLVVAEPSGGSCPAQDVADNFLNISYSQNSGSRNWAGNWVEVGESDGTSAGIARVRNDLCSGSSGNCLRLGVPSGNSAQTFTNRGAFREVDLSSVANATLSFSYRRGVNRGNQTVTLSISDNGGSSWTNLQNYSVNSTNTSTVAASFDISAYAASNTQIRFLASGNNAIAGMYIDDIKVSYQPTCPLTPFAEWRMDEASWNSSTGEVIDETGNFSGEAKNGANTSQSAPAITGNPGTCGYGTFDGASGTNGDYIALPSSFENLQGSFTITAWINPSNLDSGSRIFADDERNTQGYAFSLGDPGSGKLRFYSRGVSPISVDTLSSVIPTDRWTFVAAVHDSNAKTRIIYVGTTTQAATAQRVTGGGLSNTYTGNWGVDTGIASIGGETNSGETNNRFTGAIDEVRIYKGALTSTDINAIKDEKHPCANVIDHFKVDVLDGQGLTCEADNITIKACANAACSAVNSTATDVQLSINDVPHKTVTVTGSTDTTINYTTAGKAKLSLDQAYQCENGNPTDCDVTFANARFKFLYDADESNTIGNQVSGDNFTDVVKLQAVENVNGVCEGIFSGNKTIQLSQENVAPVTPAGLDFKVNNTSIAKFPTYSNIILNFGTDSKAIIPTPVYLDAGQISLHAKYNAGGVSLEGSNSFWVSPANLVMMAKSGSKVINGNSNISDITHKAGQVFDFTVTAYNSLGRNAENITVNYQPKDMHLLLTRIGPSSGEFEGNFNYGNSILTSRLASDPSLTFQSVTLTGFENGISSTNGASYSEVGLINLDIRDVGYGSAGNVIEGEDINIGRFYPDHFDVAIINNSFGNTCISGASDFTYIGQPFSYLNSPELRITAKNTVGVTTQNYTEAGYQKLMSADISRTFPVVDTTQDGADNTVKMVVQPSINNGVLTSPTTPTKSSLGTMTYTFNESDSFTYEKGANSQVNPFRMDYDIIINGIQDGEGVNASTSLASNIPLSNTVSPTGVNFRFGRWKIENTFGSERADLTFPMTVELYDGNNFVTNTLDTCTTFDGTNTANYSLTLNNLNNPLPATALTPVSGKGKFALGVSELKIKIDKPTNGPRPRGQIRLIYDVPAWLKYDWHWNGVEVKEFNENPRAVATFGLFRGNDRIIYQREVNN